MLEHLIGQAHARGLPFVYATPEIHDRIVGAFGG